MFNIAYVSVFAMLDCSSLNGKKDAIQPLEKGCWTECALDVCVFDLLKVKLCAQAGIRLQQL